MKAFGGDRIERSQTGSVIQTVQDSAYIVASDKSYDLSHSSLNIVISNLFWVWYNITPMMQW